MWTYYIENGRHPRYLERTVKCWVYTIEGPCFVLSYRWRPETPLTFKLIDVSIKPWPEENNMSMAWHIDKNYEKPRKLIASYSCGIVERFLPIIGIIAPGIKIKLMHGDEAFISLYESCWQCIDEEIYTIASQYPHLFDTWQDKIDTLRECLPQPIFEEVMENASFCGP